MYLFHSVRHLRQGIGVLRPHIFFSFSRSFLPRFFLTKHAPSVHKPIHSSARFSLPVRHALSRPFSPPRLPKPPVVPRNVAHVGLGTARAFHSGRPIFQNMVDNVPIATRALWEAEWDLKLKKKEARRLRRAALDETRPKSQQMLKPKPAPLTPQPSELDVYFPVQPIPAVTTHLLVPLAPTPTARLPLSSHSDQSVAPLLPLSDLAHIHYNHHLHSLRVSTLFARLDTANIWRDPGVNLDAYAFGSPNDAHEKQCTVLRVTFRGWNAARVRTILGDSAHEWYSIQETQPDGHSSLTHLPNLHQDYITMPSRSPLLDTHDLDSSWVSELGMDDDQIDLPSPLPVRASASAQHDLVLPTLDFSSAFADAVDNVPPPPQPVMLLRTVSELASSYIAAAHPSLMDSSWDSVDLSASLLDHRPVELVNDL